jgi:DNA ligase 1
MNRIPFRPLLAATIENDQQLEALPYPMIASPKVDGLRVLCHPELGPVTRSLKPVRNHHVRGLLEHPTIKGLDGEVVVGPIAADDVFARTTSGVMARDGEPDFCFHAFDDIRNQTAYCSRLEWVKARTTVFDVHYVKALPHRVVENSEEVLNAEIDWLAHGFEGVMLRSPLAHYKFGRSTLKEAILLKLKRFADAEAIVVGFLPLEHNLNEQTKNALGLAERSSHKSGKAPAELLGTLLVEHPGFGTFGIGSGFDTDLRQQIWQHQDHYLGKTVTFKYQPVGIKDKPRFPIWKAFRED